MRPDFRNVLIDTRTNARQNYKKEECPERDLRVVALNLGSVDELDTRLNASAKVNKKLSLFRVSLKDLRKSSNVNSLQAASRDFI